MIKLKPRCNNIWLNCNLTVSLSMLRTILSQIKEEEEKVDITTIIDLNANYVVKWDT